MLRAAILASTLIPAAALAQEAPDIGSPDLVFTLRGGASVAPGYFGSKEYEVGPDASFSLQYLRLGKFEFGDADPLAKRYGFGLRGSFRYIGKRDPADYPELAGLSVVDQSVELGMGIGYTAPNVQAFADVRYGVIGHESWVGEAGIDAVFNPTPDLRLRAGPRVFWGDNRYARTYFGVTAAESGASGLAAYTPSGGALSAGIELGAFYALNDEWGIDSALTWTRLTGDAGASPIVAQGDRDQFKLRVGLTKRFSFNF